MTLSAQPIISVILSGGAGTRLWPASRESCPKPFMKLADGSTLVSKAYEHAKSLGAEVLTVTNRDYYFMSRDEERLVGVSGSFLLEPFGRNTAPAIALAAKYVESNWGSQAIMLIFAADHLITKDVEFAHAVTEGINLAKKDFLVTFGVLPTKPETGFGYIECVSAAKSANKVVRFIEKPDLETAKSYLASGNYLWNSGMFCFKAGALLAELEKHAAGVYSAINKCWHDMQPLDDYHMVEIPPDCFKGIPDISLDYALMEKSDRVAVVKSNFHWSDIGSWDSFRDLYEPDDNQNRVLGDAILIDSKNNFIHSDGRLVATIGVNDLLIIDTIDALLVANSSKSQDVKKIVTHLKSNNHDTCKFHRTVSRPWGLYTILEESPGFKIKRIEVKPNGSLSLQRHSHRSEHWVVVSGVAKITNGNHEFMINANQSTYIPAGQIHRLENPADIPCVIIEVQCGTYLGEDDIVRFDDKYGR